MKPKFQRLRANTFTGENGTNVISLLDKTTNLRAENNESSGSIIKPLIYAQLRQLFAADTICCALQRRE